MNISITDDKIQELVESEVKKEVKARVQRVIDGGIAYYFTEQNIKTMAQNAVYTMINRDFVKSMVGSLDKTELLNVLSNSLAKYFCENMELLND